MRIPVLLPILSCCLQAATPLALQAPIAKVRLHPDEAWVTRVGRIHVNAGGDHLLQLRELPPGLAMEDVRVSAKGPQGTRLGDLSVGAELRKVTETPEYQALKKDRERLQDQLDAREAEGESLAHEQTFLKKLQATYDQELSGRLPFTLPQPAAVVELSKGLQARLAENLTRDRKRLHELAKLKEEADRLDRELRKRAAESSASPSQATVEVSTPKAGDLEVSFTYRTRKARWEPGYEARLASDRASVELVLFASVRQYSGEDWSGVQLEVTNARASRSLALAAFSGPQTLGYSDALPAPPPSRGRLLAAPAAVAAKQAIPQSSYSYFGDAATTEARPIEEANGLAATWALEGDKEVPADNEAHRFRVLSRELDATLVLVTVPRLDPTVYRLARFPVPSGLPLFPGAPVVHFAGTQRVGLAGLELPPPGQPLQLGFGPYRGVRAALQRLDMKKEQVGAFTKESQWTLKERFELTNDGDTAVAVELQDRELRSASDQVKITLLPESTPSQEGPKPGVRSWNLHLAPKGEGSVLLATQIRSPLTGYVTGLGNLNLPE